MRSTRRNDEFANYQGHRDYLLQDKFLAGDEGYVVEDIDLLIRAYGPLYKTDAKGRFMLIEIKYYPSKPGYAQQRTFKLIDEILKAGDKVLNSSNPRYLGYYVVQYDNADWNLSNFWVDDKKVTRDEFDEFISMGYLEEYPPGAF